MSKSVRLADYLYAEIELLAAAEKRSLANMVQVLLEQALKMERSLSEREQGHQEEGARVSARQETPPSAPRRPSAGSPSSGLVASRSESDLHFKPDFK